MTKEELGIVRLISYSEVFNFPVKRSEFSSYYMGDNLTTEEKLQASLDNLVSNNYLYYYPSCDCYFWKGKEDLVNARTEREAHSQKLIKKAKKFARAVSLLPWVRFISITGSLSANNSVRNDDIDLMVVTKRKRLWISRALVFSLLKIFGLKSDGKSGKKSGGFCINVWNDTSHLNIEKENQDVIVARDLLQTIVLSDKDSIYYKILELNQWVYDFFPMSKKEENINLPLLKSHKDNHISLLFKPFAFVLDNLDFLLFKMQVWLIEKKFPKNPYIRKYQYLLWQHPSNAKGKILERFSEGLKRNISIFNALHS